MNSTHSTRHVLSAVAFAAFALSALPAAAADKEYALKLTATGYSGAQTVTAVFRNTSPGGGASSNIKSLQLEAPAGVTLTGTDTTGCTLLNASIVRCENLTPIPKNGEFLMRVTATLTAQACGARWNLNNDDVNTGAQYGVGNWFTLVLPPEAPAGYTATLTAGLTPSISISGPANLFLNTAATITATLTNACGVPTSVTLNANVTGNGTYDLNPTSGTGSPVTFSLTALTGTSATFVVTSTNPPATNSATFEVYNQLQLACVDGVGTVQSFSAPTLGASSETDPGWFFGSRYIGEKEDCPPTPFRTTNTIGTAGGVTVGGFTLGTNSAFISYANPVNVLLRHTITFAPVWSDAQGLFNPARIKYCKKDLAAATTNCVPSIPPASNPNLLVAQGCLSPLIRYDSIPDGEPGCVQAWATQITNPVLSVTSPDFDTCGSVPRGSNRAAARCMLVTIDVLEGQDPPWGMTDE